MSDPCEPSLPTGSDLRPELPCAIQAASVDGQPQAGPYRLGCIHCDREDCDGVGELPANWKRIAPIQDWQESLHPVDPDDPIERSLFAWQTHLGICPLCDCDGQDDAPEESPSAVSEECAEGDPDEREFKEALRIHPIVRQIIDRDCHVGEKDQVVVRHVISKLRDGYQTYRALPKEDREQLVDDCVRHHAANRKEYIEVISGFRRTTPPVRKSVELPTSLTGKELVGLMRKHKVTIQTLAHRIGTTMKRIRQIRLRGLDDPLTVRDWLQAITGEDPGPIPSKYRIRGKAEETDCCFCGCPLIHGDEAYDYVGDVFCSISCCRKSKGWK